MNFMQLIVGLLIISIACIGATKIFSYGWDTQDWQIRHHKALSIARSEVEYIQGRIDSDFDMNDRDLVHGNLRRPEEVLLDARKKSLQLDDIFCYVSHTPLVFVTNDNNNVIYVTFKVHVEWQEPNETEIREAIFEAASTWN